MQPVNQPPRHPRDLRVKGGTSFRVYIAVCILGISGWLPSNALWIQSPVLVRNLPEGQNLHLLFLLLMEASSLATVAYLAARRCCQPRLSEVPVIYSALALNLTALLLLGCFWDHSTLIEGEPNSFVLLLATFIAALVNSVATVTYLPFAARLLPQYITAMLLGQALSSLIPHLLFLVQGAGRKPLCEALAGSNITQPVVYEYSDHILAPRSSPSPPVIHLPHRFSVNAFFFIHAGIVALSAISFVALRWHRRCHLEYRQPPVVQAEQELDDEDQWRCDGATYMLDDGSFSQTQLYHQHNSTHEPLPMSSTNSASQQVHIIAPPPPTATESQQYATPSSFKVLLAILLWTATIQSGPLSSIHSHACYPTGNTPFLMGALMADGAAVMACLVAARCLTRGRSQVTVVIALTCLGSILLTYFVALITFSTETDNHNSPLFGSAGELLATVAWIAVTGLFSFAKMSIGVESSEASQESVMWYSCFLRLSTVIGALCVLKDISICRLYKIVDVCKSDEL